MARNFHEMACNIIDGKLPHISNSDACALLKKLGFKDQTRAVFAETGRHRDRSNFTVFGHVDLNDHVSAISISKNNIIGGIEYEKFRRVVMELVEKAPERLKKLDPAAEQMAPWADVVPATRADVALQ